jgi:hypothetical protein
MRPIDFTLPVESEDLDNPAMLASFAGRVRRGREAVRQPAVDTHSQEIGLSASVPEPTQVAPRSHTGRFGRALAYPFGQTSSEADRWVVMLSDEDEWMPALKALPDKGAALDVSVRAPGSRAVAALMPRDASEQSLGLPSSSAAMLLTEEKVKLLTEIMEPVVSGFVKPVIETSVEYIGQ